MTTTYHQNITAKSGKRTRMPQDRKNPVYPYRGMAESGIGGKFSKPDALLAKIRNSQTREIEASQMRSDCFYPAGVGCPGQIFKKLLKIS